jgi:hypothetical protein
MRGVLKNPSSTTSIPVLSIKCHMRRDKEQHCCSINNFRNNTQLEQGSKSSFMVLPHGSGTKFVQRSFCKTTLLTAETPPHPNAVWLSKHAVACSRAIPLRPRHNNRLLVSIRDKSYLGCSNQQRQTTVCLLGCSYQHKTHHSRGTIPHPVSRIRCAPLGTFTSR